jgi:hypothetical protein
MPAEALYHAERDTWWSLAQTDQEPGASQCYKAVALDCMAKARELDIDKLQSRTMPNRKEWRSSSHSGNGRKATSIGSAVKIVAASSGARKGQMRLRGPNPIACKRVT